MTLVLARELRGRDVTVNALAPGPTATPLFFEGKTQERIDQIAALAPLNRLGTPEHVAGVVSFLAGPASRWINGQAGPGIRAEVEPEHVRSLGGADAGFQRSPHLDATRQDCPTGSG
jgi:NAD(P)-dependent dehydrogenase (short-subunit alcohol dehydrogenase family)